MLRSSWKIGPNPCGSLGTSIYGFFVILDDVQHGQEQDDENRKILDTNKSRNHASKRSAMVSKRHLTQH